MSSQSIQVDVDSISSLSSSVTTMKSSYASCERTFGAVRDVLENDAVVEGVIAERLRVRDVERVAARPSREEERDRSRAPRPDRRC
jgi:hypothetical protein